MSRQPARTTRRFALGALCTMALAATALAQPAPNARPMGGQVAAGQASISQSATATTIDQASARAVVNWQSFNVGANQSVQFVQPSTTATTLNRVLSPDPSQIAGHITANGQIVLQNQSGVVFTKGAQVDAASLVVSAPGITDQNFMAGKMVFDMPARPNAKIVNNGRITVKQSGLAALVAPQVANNGVISAKLGHVVLAGAQAETVDLYGDGMVSINVTGQVTQAPVGADGKPVTTLVTNSGLVDASGGTVELTARAVDGLVQNLVTAGGHIAANSAGGQTGRVVVSGIGGSVIVAGDVSAAGRAPGTTGGAIKVNASGGVTVAAGAHVSASGAAGGGIIAVGTTLARARGGPSVTATHTAATATITKGAVVTADATQAGTGGTVVLLSTQTTSMAGSISARGGPQGGNGGHVELSGQSGFALDGTVNASAQTATGSAGTILIDPRDLYISDSDPYAEASLDTTLTSGTLASSPGSLPGSSVDAWVTPASINNLSGAVTLTASRDLGVLSALDTTGSGITALTLNAGRNLTIASGAPITTAGDLTLYAGNALIVNAAVTAGGSIALTDLFNTGSAPTGYQYGMTLNQPITAGTGQTLSLSVAGGDHFDQLTAQQGTIEKGPSTALYEANFSTSDNSDGNVVASTVRIGTTSQPGALVATSLVFSGTNNYGTATLDLHTTGAVTQNVGSTITAGTLTGSVGSLNLPNTANSIGTLGPFAATGDITLGDSGALTLDGMVTASTFNLNTTGAVSQTDASVVNVALLTGTVGSLDLFNGNNTIGSIGPLTTTGYIYLYNGAPLTVADTLTANYIDLIATGSLTLAADVVLTPYCSACYDYDYGYAFFEVLPGTNTYANFTQTNTSHVMAQGNGSTYVYVYTYGPGSVTFNDLEAPNSELVVYSDGGNISGKVNVGNLYLYNYNYYDDYYYYYYGNIGSAAFTNTTVAGQTGTQAAAATSVYPGTNSAYLVNGCVAGSSVCSVGSNGGGSGVGVGVGSGVTGNGDTGSGGTNTGGTNTGSTNTGSTVGSNSGTIFSTNTQTVIPTIPPTPAPTPAPAPAPAPAITPEQLQAAASVASNIAVTTPVVTGVASVVNQISLGALSLDDTASADAATTSTSTTGPVGTEEQGQARTQQRGVPLVNPLGEMSRGPLRNRAPDPDLVVPNVSERDY